MVVFILQDAGDLEKADHHSREFLDAVHQAFNAHPAIPLYIKVEVFEQARAVAGGKVKAKNQAVAGLPPIALEEEKAADVGDVHVDVPLGEKRPEEKGFESDGTGSMISPVNKALQIPISKVDNYQHKVAGIVLSPNEIDLQGDICTPEEIEKASDGYMIRSQTVGNRHEGAAGAVVVQNYIAPMDFILGNQPVKKDAWVMVVKINDPVIWQDVLEGKITGFSIGGKGVRTSMEEPVPLL